VLCSGYRLECLVRIPFEILSNLTGNCRVAAQMLRAGAVALVPCGPWSDAT